MSFFKEFKKGLGIRDLEQERKDQEGILLARIKADEFACTHLNEEVINFELQNSMCITFYPQF